MAKERFAAEFKSEAVCQVTEGGYPVTYVASRLDVTKDSLYAWVKRYGPYSAIHQAKKAEQVKVGDNSVFQS